MMDFHTSYSGPYLLTLDELNQSQSDKITAKWIFEIEQNSPFKVEERKRPTKPCPMGTITFLINSEVRPSPMKKAMKLIEESYVKGQKFTPTI